jgi:hypothetical protein
MNYAELTMSEALRDPMIRLMLRADRMLPGEFAKLLERTVRGKNAAGPAASQTTSTPSSH